MKKARIVITGGQGFLGGYIVKNLINSNASFTLLDINKDDTILRQILPSNDLKQLDRVVGDVSDWDTVNNLVQKFQPNSIIHLAALQVPTCRIDPLRGARINVIGHLNVMESAKRYKDSGKPFRSVVYTSSAAITGYAKDYKDHDKNPLDDDAFHVTKTHYGVFKTANEGNSRIYWQDHQLSSFGLRPHTVFGVGREVGLTSGPTKAIKAAILGRKYQIGFTGKTSFNFVEDVAKIIVDLSQKETQGFYALNMAGPIMSAEEYLALLHKCIPESKQLISIKENAPTLPLAYNFSQKGLDKLLPGNKYTSVEESINKIANAFRELHKNGNLHDRDLVD